MPATKKSQADALEGVYQALHTLLLRYSPPLKTAGGRVRAKKDLHLTVPKAVAIPGAYGGKPVEIALASIILQKGYVGFYFAPIYMNPALKTKISPTLLKLLKGKSCFYVRKLDPDLLKSLEAMLDLGVRCFQDRGWL